MFMLIVLLSVSAVSQIINIQFNPLEAEIINYHYYLMNNSLGSGFGSVSVCRLFCCRMQ